MKCIYCKQEHPDNFIFCPMTGFRIVWDNNSKIEEREVFEYQRDLASFIPMGGKFHHRLRLVNEETKERGRRAVIFALENQEQFASIIRRSKSYDDMVSKIMYYCNFDEYCAKEIADYRYILLGLINK